MTYLGPAIIETLEDNVELGLRRGPSRTLQMVRAAGLRKGQIVEVLSGAYSSYLMTMSISERLGDVLSPDEIDWLLDRFSLRTLRVSPELRIASSGRRVPGPDLD